MIGAALYAAFPLPVVLLSDVVGAALASLALAGVKIPPLVRQGGQTGGFWAEFQAGLAVFRRDRALGRLVAAQALCMFFYAPLSAFYPLMTSDYFQRSAWYGSAVELAFAVGMVVSALVFSKVGHVGGKLRLSSLGLFAMGGGAALCVAALAAEGETRVSQICHIDRGYEDLARDLRALGADAVRVEETENG